MQILVYFLFFLVTQVCNHDLCNWASPSTPPKSCCSQELVAAETGLHQPHNQLFAKSHQNPCWTPFSRSSPSSTSSWTPSPTSWSNDRILEMQEMLESSQRQTCALPSLWRQMDEGARHDLCTSRTERAITYNDPWSTCTWPRRTTNPLELGRSELSLHVPQCLKSFVQISPGSTARTRTTQEQSSTRQQAPRSAILSTCPTTAMESRRRPSNRCCNIINYCCSGRDGQRASRSLSRRGRDARGRAKNDGEVRSPVWPTIDVSHAQGDQSPGEIQRQFEEVPRSPNQASITMACPFEGTDGDSFPTGRCLRETTERLHDQDPRHATQHSSNAQRFTEAQCAGCSRQQVGDPVHFGQGRAQHGSSGGCRRRFTSCTSPRSSEQVPETFQSRRCCGDSQRWRGNGHQHRAFKQASALYRTIWCCWQVIVGSDYVCLRKTYHEPITSFAKDAPCQVEAYDRNLAGCAACLDRGYEPWPIHSRTFTEDNWTFPFMALHHAYLLAQQCDSWTHLHGDSHRVGSQTALPETLISCIRQSHPTSKLSVERLTNRAVNFSPCIDLHIIAEDEIADSGFLVLSHDELQDWLEKPWSKRGATQRPRQCHAADEHCRTAAERFAVEFNRLPQPGTPDGFLATQPAFIQDLALAFHQAGGFDPQAPERTHEILTWYLHGHAERACRHPRNVIVNEDVTAWHEDIAHVWDDHLARHVAVHFYVVNPDPPNAEWESYTAHVILVQEPQPFERAVLWTSIFHSPLAIAIQRIAKFGRSQAHLQDCIDYAEVPRQVRFRPIQGFIGWRPVLQAPHPAVELDDGASVVLHIRQQPAHDQPHEPSPLDVLWETDDDSTSFLAHRPQPTYAPHQALVDDPNIATDEYQEIASDDESSSSVTTYDSDETSCFFHIFMIKAPMCPARIRADTWPATYSNIRHVLGLSRHEVQSIYVMRYRPADLHAAGTQVALVQHADDLPPGDTRRLILIDVVFHEAIALNTNTHRYAFLMRKDMTRRVLLEELGLYPYCKITKQKCIVRHNGQLISLSNHVPFDVFHGDYFRVDLPPFPKNELPTRAVARCLRDGFTLREARRLIEQGDTDFEWETVPVAAEEEDDRLELIQRSTIRRLTAEQVAHTQRPDETKQTKQTIELARLIDSPAQTCVDFAPVEWLAYELKEMPLNLLTHWPEELELLPVTRDYLADLVPWSDGFPVALHFYVDGSKIDAHVGAGVACFAEYNHGVALLGCMSKSVVGATQAFLGEHAAMMWALIWAIHLSDWFYSAFLSFEYDLTFNFDAMNTGFQTAGLWRTLEHKPWKTALRSLAHVLQQRHTFGRMHWNHVKAHCQQPCNELVDQLAKFAAKFPEQVANCDAILSWIHDARRQELLPWLWYLERLRQQPHDVPHLHGTWMTSLRTAPPLMPPHSTADVSEVSNTNNSVPSHFAAFDFTIATVNILTLASEDQHGRITPTKQHLLMQQFAHESYAVIGLQETRHKRIIDPHNDLYHIVGHPCDAQGHDGVQLWFAKQVPLWKQGPLMMMKHLSILESAPHFLIVMLRIDHWKGIFITGRAPHAGHAINCSEQFWCHISNVIKPYVLTHPIFWVGDTNGHIGANPTCAVGEVGAAQENLPGECFHNWLLEHHHLWAPSTFEDSHNGAQHHTFEAPNGQHSSRIDYVAIPQEIPFHYVTSGVVESIELGGIRPDHYVVMCQMKFEMQIKEAPKGPRNRSLSCSRLRLQNRLQDPDAHIFLHDQICNPPWSQDPHSSADLLACQTTQALHKLLPTAPRWRRKQHIDQATWAMVDEKKMLFRQLKQMRKTESRTRLQVIFSSWRALSSSSGLEDCSHLRGWFSLTDKAIATTQLKLRNISLRVRDAIRQADAQYYQKLASDAGHAYTHEGLTAVWRKIKGVLPKNRLRQLHARHELGNGLLHHFAELETVTDRIGAISACTERNRRDLEAASSCEIFNLEDLPTLAEIEDLCLKQRIHRAPGMDDIPPEVCRLAASAIAPSLHNLVLKAFMQGIEPQRYKGGRLCPIWKQKNSRHDPSSYRGILLADCFGKVLHAWARSRLLPTLIQRRAPGQLGGLPSQQTVTAIQILKLHGRVGRQKGITTAIIFVDLKAAFHHMLREYIFTVREPLARQTLERILDPNEFDIEKLAEDLRDASQTLPTDMPAALRTFLHDLHKSTWFQLDADSDQVVVTERGTRPGSPLADIGFNLLMAKMMHQIEAELQALPQYSQGCAKLGIQVPPLSWVDDLAIPLATELPEQMPSLMEAVVVVLHNTFRSHGMTMNFEWKIRRSGHVQGPRCKSMSHHHVRQWSSPVHFSGNWLAHSHVESGGNIPTPWREIHHGCRHRDGGANQTWHGPSGLSGAETCYLLESTHSVAGTATTLRQFDCGQAHVRMCRVDWHAYGHSTACWGAACQTLQKYGQLWFLEWLPYDGWRSLPPPWSSRFSHHLGQTSSCIFTTFGQTCVSFSSCSPFKWISTWSGLASWSSSRPTLDAETCWAPLWVCRHH